MPRRPSLKDPKLYDELRKDGASEEKAARISNSAAKQGRTRVSRKGGESQPYDEWTVTDLRQRAKDLGLHGYSHKSKAEVVRMLRDH
ncbi:Rho termination factor [Humibacter sp. RRB41]|uniref:DUF7218 family protein n=1 Tax=Humibacter sp. RRB41 TaxID=2919946 RepID=UPI001FAAB256|nr:Rho termination factor [Humibacter sp. RRB41]